MDKEILELLKHINNKIDTLDTRFDTLESRFDTLESRFDNLEIRFDTLDIKVDENSRILRALEHLAEVNKAEQDNFSNNMAYLTGDIKGLRRDVTTMEVITSKNWNDIAILKAI
ncbi:hypothetical protein [Clostridium vincentii]|uniref:Chromosome partition protein Smc n=1 Tax=Clostridium vincentii TaxID=52704 RepID=A0A2T0BGP2_9CLOT|nr:hypothetical protein [Clostridium vincentii]PRR83070.1 hypothetical protein CLVI_13190 [Clostridium vincentii]